MVHKQRNLVLGVLFVGVLMGALDIAIIGPAMPAIQAEFGLTPRQLPWLFSIYVLMQMISTSLWAKLSDFFGRRAIYVLDVAIFAVGSIVFAASHGSWLWLLLLAGRAIQGFGAGGMRAVIAGLFALPVGSRAVMRLAMHDLRHLPDDRRAAFGTQYHELFLQPLTAIVEGGMDAGTFARRDPATVVWMLLGMLYPFFSGRARDDEEQVIDDLVAVLLTGLSA
mgnify:CR=1 FL=1